MPPAARPATAPSAAPFAWPLGASFASGPRIHHRRWETAIALSGRREIEGLHVAHGDSALAQLRHQLFRAFLRVDEAGKNCLHHEVRPKTSFVQSQCPKKSPALGAGLRNGADVSGKGRGGDAGRTTNGPGRSVVTPAKQSLCRFGARSERSVSRRLRAYYCLGECPHDRPLRATHQGIRKVFGKIYPISGRVPDRARSLKARTKRAPRSSPGLRRPPARRTEARRARPCPARCHAAFHRLTGVRCAHRVRSGRQGHQQPGRVDRRVEHHVVAGADDADVRARHVGAGLRRRDELQRIARCLARIASTSSMPIPPAR